VMATIEMQILKPESFDPTRSEQSFGLVTPDIAEANLLPRLLNELRTKAPMVKIRALAMARPTAAQALENGTADLAMGYFPDLEKPGFYRQTLFQTKHVCLFRHDHPEIDGKLTLKKYLTLKHAVVRPAGREHVFDHYIHQQGAQRNVVVELSHFMSLLP